MGCMHSDTNEPGGDVHHSRPQQRAEPCTSSEITNS